MLASVTRLRIRSVRYLPAFIWRTVSTQRQTVRAPGFVGGRLLMDVRRTFWTLTVWESEKAMKVFRGSGAHARLCRNWLIGVMRLPMRTGRCRVLLFQIGLRHTSI